jgi:hypothetical protein
MGNVANECIPRYEPGQRITGKATAAITGCRLLAISGDLSTEGNIQVAPCGAGAQSVGAASHDAASGDLVTLIGSGAVVPLDVAADVAAGDLLSAAANGTVTPAGSTDDTPAQLTVGSGNSKVKVIAVEPGAAGNSIRLSIVNAGASQSLAIDVDGRDVIVTAATNGSSVITSTAAQVIAAINEDNTSSQLVTASNGASSDGTGVVAAVAATNLAGGADFAGEEGGRVIGQAYSAADFSDGDRAFVKLF